MSADPIDDPMEMNTDQPNYGLDTTEHTVEGNDPRIIGEFKARKCEKNDETENNDDDDFVIDSPQVDLEHISLSYSPVAVIMRIEYIMKHCPSIRQDCLIALINNLRNSTQNVAKYTSLYKELEELQSSEPFAKAKPPFDKDWVDETTSTVSTRLDSFLAEYKRQKDEGIKESTRRAIEDLFQHYMVCGDVVDALKLYARGVRDYCSQLKHTINMWLNWIEASIIVGDWAKVDNMAQQAIRTLRDADEAEKANQANRSDPSAFRNEIDAAIAQSTTSNNNRTLIDLAMAKIMTVQALVNIGMTKYSSAAEKILEVNVENLPKKWFVSTSDLGIYAILCCIATFKRSELKKKIAEDGTFRKLLESEPQFLDLLHFYTTSQFGKCFDIMTLVYDRLLLDPFISHNVNHLFGLIKKKCIVQYLKPYSSIKISTIVESLGFNQAQIETIVLDLIESGELDMKIDQVAGILRTVDDDKTKSTYFETLEIIENGLYKVNVILWKSTLTQGNIVGFLDKDSRGKRKNVKHPDSATKDTKESNNEVVLKSSSENTKKTENENGAPVDADNFDILTFDEPNM